MGVCNRVPEACPANLGKIAQIHARQGAPLSTFPARCPTTHGKKGQKALENGRNKPNQWLESLPFGSLRDCRLCKANCHPRKIAHFQARTQGKEGIFLGSKRPEMPKSTPGTLPTVLRTGQDVQANHHERLGKKVWLLRGIASSALTAALPVRQIAQKGISVRSIPEPSSRALPFGHEWRLRDKVRHNVRTNTKSRAKDAAGGNQIDLIAAKCQRLTIIQIRSRMPPNFIIGYRWLSLANKDSLDRDVCSTRRRLPQREADRGPHFSD